MIVIPSYNFKKISLSYLSQGESIKFISRQVGHSSAKLTLDVYSHIMEGAEEEAMQRLQERLENVVMVP